MSPDLDPYFADGKAWAEVARRLRALLIAEGLTEERKWHQPCYTHGGRNIAILQRMKDFQALAFFKGGMMADPAGLLEWPGENSRHGRRIRFTSPDQVDARADTLRAYLAEAVRLAEEGRTPPPAETSLPAELEAALAEDPALKEAFGALTPGRQRGYAIHIAAPQKPETRRARIERLRPRILSGKGMHDR